MIRLDLHVHTCYSHDSRTRPRDVLKAVKKARLDGVAITDHSTVDGALRLIQLNPPFLVIPGVEVEAAGGHVIALGVTENVPGGLSPEETVERIHELGGLAVLAHPFALLKRFRWSLNQSRLFDAVEVINSSSFPFHRSVRKSEELAESLGLPRVAGSDAHVPEAIGMAYTVVDSDSNVDDVLHAIKSGLTTPVGRPMPWRLRLKKLGVLLGGGGCGEVHG